MTQKPKVSLRPVVEAIDTLLKELDAADAPATEKGRYRVQALKTTLEGASLMLRAECWSDSANESVYEFPA